MRANQEQTSNEGGGEEKTTEETTQDYPTSRRGAKLVSVATLISFLLEKIRRLEAQKEIDGQKS